MSSPPHLSRLLKKLPCKDLKRAVCVLGTWGGFHGGCIRGWVFPRTPTGHPETGCSRYWFPAMAGCAEHAPGRAEGKGKKRKNGVRLSGMEWGTPVSWCREGMYLYIYKITPFIYI